MAAKHTTENFQVVSNRIQEATVEAFGVQAKVETRSGVGNDRGLSVDEEREVDRAVRTYIDITSSHLMKLKSRLNTFVTINKLPSEILTHIISFADLPRETVKHPYMLYTWVCRHWRSTLIQDPNLWRFVCFEPKENPFIHEFVQRSKSAPLDIVFEPHFVSTSEDLLALTSNRIRRAWFSDCNIAPLISGKTFPSLRAVQYSGHHHGGFPALLSAIVASEHLDTLHCTVETKDLSVDARDQLASILGRIRNLDIEIVENDPYGTHIARDLLRNNAKLQNLRLSIDDSDEDLTNGNNPIIFPKLQFLEIDEPLLMEHIRTPKLSSLVIDYNLPTDSMSDTFDFSSIRCLYIIDPAPDSEYLCTGSIVGLKEGVDSQSLFLTKLDDILGHFEDSVDSCFDVEDFLSYPKFPHDCFRFNLDAERDLVPVLLSILPRMTSLTDLYLLAQCRKTFFTKIVSLVPSVQNLIVTYHHNIKDYFRPLQDTSLCPRLKHLSFVTHNPEHRENKNGNSAGKLLTECLRSRQGISDNKLEYISLEMSPPLPDIWLTELQKLVATVVIV